MSRGLIMALGLSFLFHVLLLTADSLGLAWAENALAPLPKSARVQVGLVSKKRTPVPRPAKKQLLSEQLETEEISSGQDQQPKLIGGSSPPFPLASRLRGEQGQVTLSFSILADGRTALAKIIKSSGFPRLDQAALEFIQGRHYLIPSGWRGAAFEDQELTISYRLE